MAKHCKGTKQFCRAQKRLGAAARACKGKKKGAFRACVKSKFHAKHKKAHRRARRHGRRSRR